MCAGLVFMFIVSLLTLFPQVFAWELERPGGMIPVNERDENATTNENASVGLGVHIYTYNENGGGWPSYGKDYAQLQIVATANTRGILQYVCAERRYSWIEESFLPSQICLGDEQVVLISLGDPYKVRFYGGAGSAEYTAVWVSSNGWLCFYDPQHPTQPSPMPYSGRIIPDTAPPNCFVAPFWRDLKPNSGGSIRISYGWVSWWPGFGFTRTCFVISWNAKDKYGNPQIFQALLELAPPYLAGHHAWFNSMIWFQYNSITLTDSTTIGAEDQGGYRGVSYDYHDLRNGQTLELCDSFNRYAGITYLVIRLDETDPNTFTKILQDPSSIRGTHVILNQNLPPEDPLERYATAFGGGATILLGAYDIAKQGVAWASGLGLLLDCGFLAYDLYSWAAREQAAASLLSISDTMVVACGLEPDYNALPVDASLCITAYWILNDQDGFNHTLNVSAELWYEEFYSDGIPIRMVAFSTSVQLKLTQDNNNGFSTATRLQSSETRLNQYIGRYDSCDYYKIYVPQDYTIYITAWKRGIDPLDFALFLYDPNGPYGSPARANTPYGGSESISFTVGSTGDWFVKVLPSGSTYGFYSIAVSVYFSGGSGGGCPTLYVYNGSKFNCEGLLDIHNPNSTDITRNHTLTTTPSFVYGTYLMRLIEHPQTYSHIDQLKLYVKFEDQTLIQLPLVWAWHSEYGNVLPQLLFSDDWKTETIGADHNNGTSQTIDLKFIALPPCIKIQAYVFETEGNNPIGKN